MFEAFAAFLTSIGINPAHLFAGAAGALVRVYIQGKRFTWEVAGGAFGGAVCSVYLSPLIAQWLSITDAAANGGLGFVIGMIGLSLAEGVVRLAQRWANNPRISDIEKIAKIINEDKRDDD